MVRSLVGASLVTVSLALALLILPTPYASALDLVRVGVDPAGDSDHFLAPGANVESQVTSARTDVLALDVGIDGDALVVKLTVQAIPGGTGGYLYAVFFDHAGTTYYTCYTVQWIGGQQSVENVKGCSRYGAAAGTAVGPTLTGNGISQSGTEGVIVAAETTPDGDAAAITWPVPLADVAAAAGSTLTNVHVETWFRGVSDCCIGSTTDSQYQWNKADAAPDEGGWDVVLGGVAVEEPGRAALTLTMDPSALAGAPAETVRADLTVAIDTAALGGNATDQPVALWLVGADWEATFEPATLALSLTQPSGTSSLALSIPSDAAPGDVPISFYACHEGASPAVENATGCGVVEATLTVLAPGPAPPAASEPAREEPATPAANNTTDVKDDEETLPAPGFVAALALTFLTLVAASRRRR